MKKNILVLMFLAVSTNTFSQEKNEKFSLSGYFSDMQTVFIDSFKGDWVNDNVIRNRLNFSLFFSENFSFNLGLRTSVYTGETVKYFPGYPDIISKNFGFFDLNKNIVSENSIIVNTNADRLYFNFEKNKLSITLGRQRINWGKSFVWNPDDVFNSYSFFDFDYPEKPGTDAVRIEYYTGITSSAELVVASDYSKKISVAGKYNFNVSTFDVQVLGGLISENDFFVASGWEGFLKNVSLRGEANYLHPKNNFADTTGVFILDLSSDYTFKNSLSLQFEFLYSPKNEKEDFIDFRKYYYEILSVKNLSFAEYNFFAGVSYPVTPIFKASLYGMYYPKIEAFFIAPDLSFSLSDNSDFSLFFQTFGIRAENPQTGKKETNGFTTVFLRLKYNF